VGDPHGVQGLLDFGEDAEIGERGLFRGYFGGYFICRRQVGLAQGLA
jgi:hypothetical protein